ncbi:MAG: ATP-binding protein [Bacteroidales bacterium]|nr:ATP-binding protein [Bacteroidales bacterium]
MIFERKIYSKLLEWKQKSNGTKAILVEGARRIGKSTIIEEFARKEYESYIIIDFSDVNKDIIGYFENNLNDLDAFFMLLATEFGVELHKRKSVIVFDEVQRYPKARQAIKKLVKDGRYDYIETGSLISIKDSVKNIVIPSEERSIKMYPLDFEEFAWAFGEKELILYIRKCFAEKKPLERSLHNKAMLLFKQYMLVGGMPQSLVAYLENERKFSVADDEKRDILNLYRSDIMKIGAKYRSKVLSIFDQIPSFLSQHEKRVVFSDIAEGSYFNQYADTFFWLGDSMVVNECFSCTDPNIGLSLNESRSFIKCYLGDTGLLVSHAFDENEIVDEELYKQILNDKLSLNEGMLFENAIAQILVSNGHKLYFYVHYDEKKHRNDIEIDFIISNSSKTKFKIFPIEVKSTKNYSTFSLEKFILKFKQRIDTAYIIHPKNLVIKEKAICIPPYMAICL